VKQKTRFHNNIILISGRQGSGKSTLADGLQKFLFLRQSFKVFRVKFADTLYKLHTACLPILKDAGVRPEEMTKDGELLQVLGTEYGRKCIDEDVWAKAARRNVDDLLLEYPAAWIIIDDCRFENEFNIFDDAVRVRLFANPKMRQARASYWRKDTNHPSETGLDSYHKQGYFDLEIETNDDKTKPVLDVLDYLRKVKLLPEEGKKCVKRK
jgi:hypothetical protein